MEPAVQAAVLVAAAERLDTRVTEAHPVVVLVQPVLAAALVVAAVVDLAEGSVYLAKEPAVLAVLVQSVRAVVLEGALAKLDSLLMVACMEAAVETMVVAVASESFGLADLA